MRVTVDNENPHAIINGAALPYAAACSLIAFHRPEGTLLGKGYEDQRGKTYTRMPFSST